jgi:hypothetical protein
MRFPRKRGATSVKARVFIPDNSVTTGAGCTGLTNASANLAICYSRENDNGGTEVTGANLLDITTLGTWADPGAGKLRFKAVDATKLPGLYEIHFPDAAAFGTGDTSQNIIINVYEKTTTALKIGPNMVLIPLALVNVLDGEANTIQVSGTAQTAGDLLGVWTPTKAGYVDVAITSRNAVTPPTVGQIDTQLSGTHGAGAWGAGTGASSKVYTVTIDGAPGAGVYVRMTTDAAGVNAVDAGTTDAAGAVTLHHDLAVGTTVYLWRVKAGVEFSPDPDVEVL